MSAPHVFTVDTVLSLGAPSHAVNRDPHAVCFVSSQFNRRVVLAAIPPDSPHSYRSDTSGSTRIARSAGPRLAVSDTTTRKTVMAENVSGS